MTYQEDERSGGERRSYGRDGKGSRDYGRRDGGRPKSYGNGGYNKGRGSSGGYGKGGRSGGYKPREFKPRDSESGDESGEREFKPRRYDNDRGDRDFKPRRYDDRGGRDFKPREFKPRDSEGAEAPEAGEGSGEREFRPRRYDDRGGRYGDRRSGGRDFKPRRYDDRGGRDFKPREFKPRDSEGAEAPEAGEGSGEREFRPRRYDDRGGRYGDRRSGGYGGRDRGYKPREYRTRDFAPRDGETAEGAEAPEAGEGSGEREFRPRRYDDRGGRDFKPRRYDDDRGGRYGDRRSGGYGGRDRGYGDRRDDRRFDRDGGDAPVYDSAPKKLAIPAEPMKMLYRGIDLQVNGKNDGALVMFLHGASRMNKGCENNALSMLRDIGKENFAETRAKMAEMCDEDAMTEFDYLCITLDKNYDRSAFDSKFEQGDTHAIYRKISLEELEGDDPAVDTFASRYVGNEAKIVDGLTYLKRRKDSPMAEQHLQEFEDRKKAKQSVYVFFDRAMNGDEDAAKELEALSAQIPEAAFFTEYLGIKDDQDGVEWLKAKFEQFKDLIIAEESHFQVRDTPFGTYLRAKSLQAKKEEWIPFMIKSAKAGCPEALEELKALMYRGDIRKVIAGIYLEQNDLPALLSVYEAGLNENYYLEQYCHDDPQLVFQVGSELGKRSPDRQIDWLKGYVDNGMDECRAALIEMASDERFQGKKLIYVLHDIGENVESAKLYFQMEGDPSIPAYKWLRKVCETEDGREFVRSHYEAIDDLDTFESIFVDDGYERKRQGGHGGRGGYGGGRGGRGGYGGRRPRY